MAIALDAVTDSGNNTASWSHTVASGNPILFVCAQSNGDDITGCSYNSVAMTLVDKKQMLPNSNGAQYLFVLFSPATGTNTVALTTTSSAYNAIGLSYTGADQVGPVDSTAKNGPTSTTSLTTTTTVVASNCWLVGTAATGNEAPAGGTGTTMRGTSTNNPGDFFRAMDSNGTVGTGSQSLITTTAGSTFHANIIASFAPAAAAAASTVVHNLTLLGVGQ